MTAHRGDDWFADRTQLAPALDHAAVEHIGDRCIGHLGNIGPSREGFVVAGDHNGANRRVVIEALQRTHQFLH